MDDVNLEGRVDRRPESQAVGCTQYEAASAARLAHDRSQTPDEVPGIGDVFDDVRGENDGEPVTHQFRARSLGAQAGGKARRRSACAVAAASADRAARSLARIFTAAILAPPTPGDSPV